MSQRCMDEFAAWETERLLRAMSKLSGVGTNHGIVNFNLEADGNWELIHDMYQQGLAAEGKLIRPVADLKEQYRLIIDSARATSKEEDLSLEQRGFCLVADRLEKLKAGAVSNTGTDPRQRNLYSGKWKVTELQLLYDVYVKIKPANFGDFKAWAAIRDAFNADPSIYPTGLREEDLKESSLSQKKRDPRDRRRALSTIVSKVKDVRKINVFRNKLEQSRKALDECLDEVKNIRKWDRESVKRQNVKIKRRKAAMEEDEAFLKIVSKFVEAMGATLSRGTALTQTFPSTPASKRSVEDTDLTEESSTSSSNKKQKKSRKTLIEQELSDLKSIVKELKDQVTASQPPKWLEKVLSRLVPKQERPVVNILDRIAGAEKLKSLNLMTEEEFQQVCAKYKAML